LSCHATDLRNDGAGETANAEFEALEIFHRLDFLPEPAAHLGARAAGRNTDGVKFLQEVVEQFCAAAKM
jgi:hypothetical protein